jgi:hypothetical protein
MTDRDQGNQELIDLYLANRLGDAERELVETRIVNDLAFRREVELTEALQDGLRELQRQGKVAPLLKTRTWMWRRAPFAITASIMALAIGVAVLLLFQRLERVQQQLAAAPGELVVATLRFEQTRGGADGPDVSWQRTATPALLEMQFDVGLDAAPGYSIFIKRTGPDLPILKANVGSISPDGVVSLSINSALLAPGDYRIRLDPQPMSPTHPDAAIYVLRITD